MKVKDILKLIISVAIIGAILFYLYSNNYFKIVNDILWIDWTILLGLTLVIYLLSGIQLYFLVHHINGTKLKFTDVLFIPMSINLFGYIIPTNGGFLYAVLFFKKKYMIDTTSGFSIGFFSIYLSFIISGICMLVAMFLFKSDSIYLIIFSFVLIFSPILVYGFNFLIRKIPSKKGSLFQRAKDYLDTVVVQSGKMIRHGRIMTINIILTLISMTVLFLMYYELNDVLKINMPVLSLIALLVMMRVSSLIRILPGNLGLEELFAAGLFTVIGNDPSVGMVFSVFLRFCAVILMIPSGITHTVFNSKYFNFTDIKKMRNKNPG